MPRQRQAHAYMYNRGLQDKDTVSLVYPNMNASDCSSIYYASLSSSVHKMNGTRKRAKMMDPNSQISDAFSMSAVEEVDAEEEHRRKQAERMKYRKNKDDTIIGKLKKQVSLGKLKQQEFENIVGPSATNLKQSRINSMVTVDHDPELKAKIKKDFKRLFDDYIETLLYQD